VSKTTIVIKTTTREKLRHIGRKNQTYDQLINELIERKGNSQDLLDDRFATLPLSESAP
jgi:predicted CopG family antitoxin